MTTFGPQTKDRYFELQDTFPWIYMDFNKSQKFREKLSTTRIQNSHSYCVLQSMGSQRVAHDWATELHGTSHTSMFFFLPIYWDLFSKCDPQPRAAAAPGNFFLKIYLFGCVRFSLSHMGSFLVAHRLSGASQVVLVVKNLPASAGDLRDVGLIPVLGKSSGEGNGNPLQYSCLENLVDRGAWWATVLGVTKSHTWLKWLSSSSMFLGF